MTARRGRENRARLGAGAASRRHAGFGDVPWDRETYEMALEALLATLKQAPVSIGPDLAAAIRRCFVATFASIAIARETGRR